VEDLVWFGPLGSPPNAERTNILEESKQVGLFRNDDATTQCVLGRSRKDAAAALHAHGQPRNDDATTFFHPHSVEAAKESRRHLPLTTKMEELGEGIPSHQTMLTMGEDSVGDAVSLLSIWRFLLAGHP